MLHIHSLLRLEKSRTHNTIKLASSWFFLISLHVLEFLLVLEIIMDLIMVFAVMFWLCAAMQFLVLCTRFAALYSSHFYLLINYKLLLFDCWFIILCIHNLNNSYIGIVFYYWQYALKINKKLIDHIKYIRHS